LKTVGLGLRIYSNDHEDRFPWQVSTNDGGSLEYALTGEVFRHFQAASNEIGMTKYLLCPSDTTRLPALNFAPALGNSNLSYFVGLDASETNAQMILSGDRHITVNGTARTGVVSVFSTNVVGWSSLLHGGHGNIGLADGSVQQASPGTLQSPAHAAEVPAFRLAIP
jgi:prepilin-type processing-associated H-X9-DG protein